MARRKRNKAMDVEGGQLGQAEQQERPNPAPEYVQPADPPRAALAVHPHGTAVALAVGGQLRLYDARCQQLRVLVDVQQVQAEQARQGAGPYLRGVAFDPTGRRLLAGSEDKAAGLRLWECGSWQLEQAIKVPKKVTAVAFTRDGRYALGADKFGDVLAAAAQRPAGLPEQPQQRPEVVLGHYCAILTSLTLSASGRLLATTDRDQHVRVSVVPADPAGGAHEIQSFCLGHTSFVTCSTFAAEGEQEVLITGGGDGTLRLWDPQHGALLHTLRLPDLPAGDAEQHEEEQTERAGAGQQQHQQGNEAQEAAQELGAQKQDEAGSCSEGEGLGEAGVAAAGGVGVAGDTPVPLALAAANEGGWVVAAVDGCDELLLLRVDWSARQLRECGWWPLAGLHLPASLAFDASGRLWAAGGPVADDSTAVFLACGTVVLPHGATGSGGEARLANATPPEWLPPSAVARLQALAGDEATALAAAAERRLLASRLLRKRQYSLAQLEQRKRLRRDRVLAAAGREVAMAEHQAQA